MVGPDRRWAVTTRAAAVILPIVGRAVIDAIGPTTMRLDHAAAWWSTLITETLASLRTVIAPHAAGGYVSSCWWCLGSGQRLLPLLVSASNPLLL